VRVRAARGAIVIATDRDEDVLGSTQRLLEEMIERNEVATDDLVSILFTATEDLRSAFPAEAARRIQPKVAIPMHWGTVIGSIADAEEFAQQAPVEARIPVYLDGAEALRDDLDADT